MKKDYRTVQDTSMATCTLNANCMQVISYYSVYFYIYSQSTVVHIKFSQIVDRNKNLRGNVYTEIRINVEY